MAKKKNIKKTKKANKTALSEPIEVTKSVPFWLQSKWQCLILFSLACLIYGNTLKNGYTQDDAIVIYDNMFTQEGISGIPGILKYDTFFGFFKEAGKEKLVSGGRYRPFTLIMFAVEWQVFGKSPFINHLVNVLLFGGLCIMIYLLLARMFVHHKSEIDKSKNALLPIFLMALLFVVHPIHTEAVANIKGRDEIMTMLGAIIALWSLFKFIDTQNQKWNIIALVSFFIALMSKENAITFLAVAPLSLYFFGKQSLSSSLKSIWPIILATIIFLGIRFSVLGADFGGTPNELMNNPYLKIVGNKYVEFSFAERMATIFFTLGKYIILLIFPHPLSHDYYPRAIEVMSFTDWQSILSLLTYIGLVAIALLFWTKDKIISYGILFYLITLSIVSNIVFPIGTNMSERFLFIPSLGYTIVIVRLLYNIFKKDLVVYTIGGLVLVVMSVKTFTRNFVWQDDFTLFTTDVKTQPRSAKLLNAAGGALSTKAAELEDGPEKTKMLNEAINYLNQAVEIHPTYRNAYLLLGNSNYYLKNFKEAIQSYDQALAYDPNFKDVLTNLPIVLREGGKHMGQQMGDLETALKWLLRSYNLNAQDYETCRLIGVAYGINKQNQKAIEFFQKAIALKPDLASNYTSLGTAYQAIGNEEKARESYTKAIELDPKALDYLKNK